MDAIRRAHPLAPSGFRRFPAGAHHIVPGLFTDDPDCLHTSAVADLATAPSVLHLPNTHGRYLSVTLFDAAGEPFASLGSSSGDILDNDVLVAGPQWHGEASRGVRALRAPSDLVWALSRIIARSAADRGAVEALAARQRFSPSPPSNGPVSASAWPELGPLELTSLREIAEMEPLHLLHRLMLLIERAPRAAQEEVGVAIRGRCALLGVDLAGKDDGPPREMMLRGFADGWKAIEAARQAEAPDISGEWRMCASRAPAPTAPVARAAFLFDRLGAPLPEDVVSFRCWADEAGRPLVGAEQYRIFFSASALPPALSAWRLTAHNGHGRPGEVIGDHSPLTMGRDGSLELILRREPADRGPAANWLRIPPGPFQLTLRLYLPSPEALPGWRMAKVERLGSRLGSRRGEQERGTRSAPRRPPRALRGAP
jgi:hypothetical protein